MLSSILLEAGNLGLGYGVAALGAGLAALGAGVGIGRIGGSAAFFAMVVGLLVTFKA